MNDILEKLIKKLVCYFISFLLIIMSISLMIYYIICPSFFSDSVTKINAEDNYINEYKLLKNEVINKYKKEYNRKKSAAQLQIQKETEKYHSSDGIENVITISYTGDSSISEIYINDLIAIYNTVMKFSDSLNDDNKTKEFISQIEEYFSSCISEPIIQYEVSEIAQDKETPSRKHYAFDIKVEIKRNSIEFLKGLKEKAIKSYQDKEKISYKQAEQQFYQYKQLSFDCLCNQTGVKMNYSFVRANSVKQFVSAMDKSRLAEYDCSRKKAINSNAVTTYYGIKPDGTMHNGVDIGNVGETTKLYAINDGIVVSSYYDKNLGNTWYTDKNNAGNNMVVYYGVYNGNYVFYFYCHLSQVYFKANDIVTGDSIIAQTGNTGTSTGPHLHWEVVLMDINTGEIRTVDPLSYCIKEEE